MLFFRFKNLVMLRSHYKDNINNMGDMLVVKVSEKCKISLKNKRILYKRALWGRRLGGRHVVRLLSCVWLCNPMGCSRPGFSVLHYLLEFAQTLVHWVSDAIQPSHPLSSPSPPAFNLSQHQGPFQWVSSSQQVVKVVEIQLQQESFQWTFRVEFL